MGFRNTSKKDTHNEINVSSNGSDIQSLILAELIKLNKTLGRVISQNIDHERRIRKLEKGGGA